MIMRLQQLQFYLSESCYVRLASAELSQFMTKLLLNGIIKSLLLSATDASSEITGFEDGSK